MEPQYDPVIPFLIKNPKDLKSAYYSDTVTSMFIAVQVTIAKLWDQPRCLSTDEWIKKTWGVCTHTHNGIVSAINKNEIMAFACKWMELETIMLSEISSPKKSKAKCFLRYVVPNP